MTDIPPVSGCMTLNTPKHQNTQALFSISPVQSAPAKLPCWPLFDASDERPALPLYDLATREPERRCRLWRCGRKVIFGPPIKPAVNPDICERVLRAFADASERPAKRKSRGRTEQSTSIGKSFFRHAAGRAWTPPPKRTGAFSDWDDTPDESFAAKRQNEMAKLIDAYLLAGGRITYRVSYIHGRRRKIIGMKPLLTLRLDGYGTWRVEKIDNDLAETVGYFGDFLQAQSFALHAARLWGFEFDAAAKSPPQPIKRDTVIAL